MTDHDYIQIPGHMVHDVDMHSRQHQSPTTAALLLRQTIHADCTSPSRSIDLAWALAELQNALVLQLWLNAHCYRWQSMSSFGCGGKANSKIGQEGNLPHTAIAVMAVFVSLTCHWGSSLW